MRMMDDERALMRGVPDDIYGVPYYAGSKMATSTTSARHGGLLHGGLVSISTEPSEFQNFIKCPPLQKLNLVPKFDDNGLANFNFTCDLTPFS